VTDAVNSYFEKGNEMMDLVAKVVREKQGAIRGEDSG